MLLALEEAMSHLPYLSDLSDDEWDLIKPFIPVHRGVGHPQEVNLREIVNAILYWADNGIKWRAMPHDLPKRTSEKKGPDQGIGGHKCIKGRKRHIVVDILGMVLNCFVSAANMADIKVAVVALEPVLETYMKLEKVLADQAYKGALEEIIEHVHHCILEVITKLREGFVPAPYR